MPQTKRSTTSRGIEWRVIRYDSSPGWLEPTMEYGLEFRRRGETYFHGGENYFEETGREIPATIKVWARRVSGGWLFPIKRNPRTPLPSHVPVNSRAWMANFEREFHRLGKADQRRIIAEVRAEQRRMRPVQTNPKRRRRK